MEQSELSARVAENIRKTAKRKKVALIRLADFAGVSRAHLFAFLKGERDITLGWLAKIAAVLEIDPAELVGPPVARPK